MLKLMQTEIYDKKGFDVVTISITRFANLLTNCESQKTIMVSFGHFFGPL